MPLLTPEQIAELKKIVEDSSKALAITTMGHEVPKAELQRLVKEGYIKTSQLSDVVLDSFTHGRLMQQLPAAKDMDHETFTDYLKKNPVEMSAEEKHAYEVAKTRGGLFATGIGDRFKDQLGSVLVQVDQQYATKVRGDIGDANARKIAARSTVKHLADEMQKLTKDWEYNWERVANTESHLAHQEGFFEATVALHGEDALMAKMPEPGACAKCLELYTKGGTPIIKPASWWAEQGVANVGLKPADWKPVLGGIHPGCRCQLLRVPNGWGFNEANELVPQKQIKKAEDVRNQENLESGTDELRVRDDSDRVHPVRQGRGPDPSEQLELFKGAQFSGYTGAVAPKNAPMGTMGHHSKPARTAGENVRTAPPVEGWPPGKDEKKKKRKKRKLPDADKKVGIIRGKRLKKYTDEETNLDRMAQVTETDDEIDPKEARENLERQQRSRAELVAGQKLSLPPQKFVN